MLEAIRETLKRVCQSFDSFNQYDLQGDTGLTHLLKLPPKCLQGDEFNKYLIPRIQSDLHLDVNKGDANGRNALSIALSLRYDDCVIAALLNKGINANGGVSRIGNYDENPINSIAKKMVYFMWTHCPFIMPYKTGVHCS